MTELTGRILMNRYHVQELIGRGGMADVYKVWDQERSAFLALKYLHSNLAHDAVFLDRFQKEAEDLKRLEHPYIVRYYGLEFDRSSAFILMDFIEGQTLRAKLSRSKDKKRFPQTALSIMQPVCSALQYAHNRKKVHCDVKPENILIEKTGKVFLTDFGIARVAGASTSSRSIEGTPYYMAPEQAEGRNISPQTDIYALGIILYEIQTGGRLPFTGKQAQFNGTKKNRVLWEQINCAPASPRIYNPDISPAMERLILRCLEKNPNQRNRSTIILYNNLTKIVSEIEKSNRPEKIESNKKPETSSQPNDNGKGWTVLQPQWLPSGSKRLGIGIALLLLILIAGIGLTQTGIVNGKNTPSNNNTYIVDDCMMISDNGVIKARECVTSVSIQTDGSMQYNVSWTFYIPENEGAYTKSDRGNQNIFLTDDLNNHYNHYDVGGVVDQSRELRYGDETHGWYLFPPADLNASSFIFHDDDNGVQTQPIPRLWP